MRAACALDNAGGKEEEGLTEDLADFDGASAGGNFPVDVSTDDESLLSFET